MDHDIGFLFLPTSVANWRKTGNVDARRRGLHAANLLAARFNPVGNHILIFDSQTGEFITNSGGQGYGQGSSWSRGQSWAVNGWLPLVDYRAPARPVKYDSTAGMITAAGLLELAKHVGEYEKQLYTKAALNILKACEAKFCNWNPEQDSIVTGGTYFYHDPDGTNTEVPIIYGDYYFIEAILKLKDEELFIW